MIESYWGGLKLKIYRQYVSHGNERTTEQLAYEAAWRIMNANQDMLCLKQLGMHYLLLHKKIC